MRRLRAGYLLVRNPMNAAQLRRVPLSPASTDCIVFWTKDASPFERYLDELDDLGYRYYFQYTITPYGAEFEPHMREKREIMRSFCELSRRLGKHRTLWRYDPVITDERHSAEYHRERFFGMCEALAEYTESVTLSFLDVYAKHAAGMRAPSAEEEQKLAEYFGKTARSFGLEARMCCEKDYSRFGIAQARCVDAELAARLCGAPLRLGHDKNQRAGCGCAESVDVGAYDTCTAGCVYCYANAGAAAAQRRAAAHDPLGELLIGKPAGERVTEILAKSVVIRQITLDL